MLRFLLWKQVHYIGFLSADAMIVSCLRVVCKIQEPQFEKYIFLSLLFSVMCWLLLDSPIENVQNNCTQ